jgi:hypothetical protein
MKNTYTLGADPELFVFSHEKNRIVSSIPVVIKDKHDPIDLGDGIKMYADNVLLETSFPPSDTKDGAIKTIKSALTKIQDWLGRKHSLVAQASHVFSQDDIGAKPDLMRGQLPVEWEIGCNPSWNAYTRKQTIPAPFASGLRSGSFHIHVGSELLDDILMKEVAIKMFDLLVGCSSVIIDKDETTIARRMLYGKAGEFRPTDYGVEWRVLGNYALRSPQLTELIFDLVDYAMDQIACRNHKFILDNADMNLVQTAINTGNKTLAEVAIKKWIPSGLVARIHNAKTPDLHRDWSLA